nr:MAG TPA: hypothetical protein [Caudoviricetes sp.]
MEQSFCRGLLLIYWRYTLYTALCFIHTFSFRFTY